MLKPLLRLLKSVKEEQLKSEAERFKLRTRPRSERLRSRPRFDRLPVPPRFNDVFPEPEELLSCSSMSNVTCLLTSFMSLPPLAATAEDKLKELADRNSFIVIGLMSLLPDRPRDAEFSCVKKARANSDKGAGVFHLGELAPSKPTFFAVEHSRCSAFFSSPLKASTKLMISGAVAIQIVKANSKTSAAKSSAEAELMPEVKPKNRIAEESAAFGFCHEVEAFDLSEA
mmetsp:Transcript_83394/g.210230  ORF Transcript_83394/g.210230 Transcript_83394/m.210230 type:complete len:228 (+) Transcript_83394:1081-1764(+)